jgi:hypothetical protein
MAIDMSAKGGREGGREGGSVIEIVGVGVSLVVRSSNVLRLLRLCLGGQEHPHHLVY